MRASRSRSVSSRKAVRSDIPLIKKIEFSCFNRHDRFKDYQIRRFVANPSGSVITDIILYNTKPAGWAVYFTRKDSGIIRLYSVCVLPEFSGKGLATSYLAERIKSFRDFGKMVLEVRTSNRKAIRLYSKLGFIEDSVLKGYYPDGESALRMTRELIC